MTPSDYGRWLARRSEPVSDDVIEAAARIIVGDAEQVAA